MTVKRIKAIMLNYSDLKPFLREGEVATLLDLSVSNLQKRRWKRMPPAFVKLGRNVRYRREDILKYIEDSASKGGENA